VEDDVDVLSTLVDVRPFPHQHALTLCRRRVHQLQLIPCVGGDAHKVQTGGVTVLARNRKV
jgi:hypothetical protein